MTYADYCAALVRSRSHPEGRLTGLEAQGLRLASVPEALALGYPLHMAYQVWPQPNALVCIIPKGREVCAWTMSAASAEHARTTAGLDD